MLAGAAAAAGAAPGPEAGPTGARATAAIGCVVLWPLGVWIVTLLVVLLTMTVLCTLLKMMLLDGGGAI
jgi:hypothetical protein